MISHGERRDLTLIMLGDKDNPLLAGLSGDLAPMVSFVMSASHCQSPALGSADPSPAHAVPGLRGADQRVSRERLVVAGHVVVAGKLRGHGGESCLSRDGSDSSGPGMTTPGTGAGRRGRRQPEEALDASGSARRWGSPAETVVTVMPGCYEAADQANCRVQSTWP